MPVFSDKPPTDEQIFGDLGDAYFEAKKFKELTAELRTEFFTVASASFTEKDLARKTVEIPEDQLADPEAYALLYNPGWRLASSTENSVTIEEDPDYKPFTGVFPFEEPRRITNSKGKEEIKYGYVITRSIASGTQMIDDERLKEVNRDLWEGVTQWKDQFYVDLIGFTASDLWAWNWPRVVKSPDVLTEEQIAGITPYLYEGPKTVKLLVRYAKAEELE